MTRTRCLGMALLFAPILALGGCCCGGSAEARARASAEDFFRAIQVLDFKDAHELLNPYERDMRSVGELRDRVDEFRPLSGHTWVDLDTVACSEHSCTIDGVFDPTGIHCEIEMTLEAEAWVVERVEVDGDQVLPWI